MLYLAIMEGGVIITLLIVLYHSHRNYQDLEINLEDCKEQLDESDETGAKVLKQLTKAEEELRRTQEELRKCVDQIMAIRGDIL